jgi:8-oxo-dGTP pyrophosphatase MutT (NUDIX family)
MLHLATTLRRFPWTVRIGRWFWRLARPKFSLGVIGVAFNSAGQVLIVEHVFHPYRPWGLPGGWVESREGPAISLQREFQEELELDIEVGPVVALGKDFDNHLDLAFLCYPQGTIGALSFELLDYRWVDPENLPELYTFHHEAIQQAQKFVKLEALSP